MKHLLTLIGCCLALSLSAQELVVDYPYNPDYENDGNVGVEDLLQLLAYFDMGFEVDDIVIDEVTLTQWLQTISQTLIAQQATIDSIQGLISTLDSTMVADMIAGAGGSDVGFIQGSAFGERVNLGEPEDWGPLPWDAYVNYGVYDFESDGLVMGQLNYPFYKIALLPDSLDVQDLSHEVFDEHEVASFDGQESFTIAVRADEKMVIEGMPNAFEYDYILQWIPLNTGDSSNDNNDLSLDSSGPCQGELTVNYHGYDYELVEIDDQCWFKENLRTSQFQNGEDINEGLQDVVNPESGYLPAGNPLCGCVYNKAVIYDGREVCPSGFQIPQALDFSELIGSTTGWPLINENLTGFNALFGSGTDPLYIDGNNCGTWYHGFGWGNLEARFLTSTVSQSTSDSDFPDEYWDFLIYGEGWTDFDFGDIENNNGQYIRCLKDTE